MLQESWFFSLFQVNFWISKSVYISYSFLITTPQMNVNPYDLGTESEDQDMDESSLLDTSSIKNYEEKISKVRSFVYNFFIIHQ